MMDIVSIYGICFGALFGLIMLCGLVSKALSSCPRSSSRPPTCRIVAAARGAVRKHLVYSSFIRRGKLFRSWSRIEALLVFTYVGANASCVAARAVSIAQASKRAGTLSLINMVFSFAGPHLGFVADVLGVPLMYTRRLHASVGLVSVALALFHATVSAVMNGIPSLHHSRELFAVVAIVLICAQIAPLSLRRFSYEIALRAHQLLSFGLVYCLWRHLPSASLFPRLYLYICAGSFATSSILQFIWILYRNKLGLSRARISYDLHTIKVRLHLRRPMKVAAGQYINLWIPSASLSSFTQTHPFTVVSWSEKPQDHIDLFIEPRQGLTKDLFGLSQYGPTTSIVMFSGPHGRALSADSSENVILIASGFGIAAQLPFVKKLIYDHHSRKSIVRRIHLVWQIDDLDVGIAAQQLLNDALEDDSLDGDYILRISIYLTSEDISKVSFGSRATVYPGPLDLTHVLADEVAERRPKSSTIISVSADEDLREDISKLMKNYSYRNVDVIHTDYQPSASIRRN